MSQKYHKNHKTTVYLSSAYLAPVQYYSKLFNYDKVVIEQYEHYIKQTYRNRCHIAGPSGIQALSIPVTRPETPKAMIKDIRISDHGNWRHLHWNAIESSYNSTPFFEYYKDDFRPFYEKKYNFLADFNVELMLLVCKLIDLEVHILGSDEFKTEFLPGESDFRESIRPKKDLGLADPEFKSVPYYQVFESRHGFLPNLSIIDLLFNMGPESLLVLRDTVISLK